MALGTSGKKTFCETVKPRQSKAQMIIMSKTAQGQDVDAAVFDIGPKNQESQREFPPPAGGI